MQDQVEVVLESAALTKDTARIHELSGIESFNQPFDFAIELHTKDNTGLDEVALLTQAASLVFTRAGVEQRRLFGAICEVRDSLHSEREHLVYRLHFVPRLWKISQIKKSQVFVDQSVPDIVKAKLEQAGFVMPDDFELRLSKSYPPRDLVVQYEESDLHFVSRLVEHLGIAYFFEHQSGRDVVVFSDDNGAFKDIEGGAEVPFRNRGEEDGVFAIEGTTRAIPTGYVVKDYNYRTPGVSLVKSAPIDGGTLGEVVEYGAHFRTVDEAQDIANVRAQEALTRRKVFDGKSRTSRLRAAAKFTLEGHPRAEPKLLLTTVRHRAVQTTFHQGTGEEVFYLNEFTAIPDAVVFRPPRVTPKPKVHGAISGVIEAESPGQYAELDGDGRYHVRFMLDQGDAPHGKASSLLRMAQPHAGPGYGFHFPLRDGVEVVITCIEGDPDRPIITGAVPNPTTPSTVSSGNGQRNVIKTGGGTEMNIDDTEGSTRFKISVPHKNTVFQLGAPNAPGDGMWTSTEGNATVSAKGFIDLGSESMITIHCTDFMKLDANSYIDITSKGSHILAQAQGGDFTATASANTLVHALGGDANVVASAKVVLEGGSKLEGHAPVVGIKGDATVTIEGGAGAFLKGGPIIEVTGTMVYIHGVTAVVQGSGSVVVTAPTVNIDGGSTVNVKSGGVVNVTGGGPVNVKGSKVNLNC